MTLTSPPSDGCVLLRGHRSIHTYAVSREREGSLRCGSWRSPKAAVGPGHGTPSSSAWWRAPAREPHEGNQYARRKQRSSSWRRRRRPWAAPECTSGTVGWRRWRSASGWLPGWPRFSLLSCRALGLRRGTHRPPRPRAGPGSAPRGAAAPPGPWTAPATTRCPRSSPACSTPGTAATCASTAAPVTRPAAIGEVAVDCTVRS